MIRVIQLKDKDQWEKLYKGYADFYKKDITINVLGPVGDKVEEWILKGCIITQATFGELSFDTDDPMQVEVTVQPDLCILNY